MHSLRICLAALAWLALCLSACRPAPTPAPTSTSRPPLPAATATPLIDLSATAFQITQTFLVGTATARGPSSTPRPATSTAPPSPTPTPTPLDAGRPVTIPVSDGVSLTGTLYGQGERAVIFSNMGDQHQASWAPVAREMAAAGYLALTYDFRYWVNGRMDTTQIQFIADDLSAAVAFARDQGAETVVLVGASLGGMATAKVAADAGAAAVAILAAPMTAPGVEVAVSVEELSAIAVPQLYITSEFDDTVLASALEAMYAQACEPKELYVYPGASAHGTHLLQTDHAEDLRARLLAFVNAHAGAAPTPTPAPLFAVHHSKVDQAQFTEISLATHAGPLP